MLHFFRLKAAGMVEYGLILALTAIAAEIAHGGRRRAGELLSGMSGFLSL